MSEAIKMRNLRFAVIVWFAQCAMLVQASGYGVLPRAASSSAAAPTPVSVSPSQNWYGSICSQVYIEAVEQVLVFAEYPD